MTPLPLFIGSRIRSRMSSRMSACMSSCIRSCAWLIVSLLAQGLWALDAAAARDPMQPPESWRAQQAVASGSTAAPTVARGAIGPALPTDPVIRQVIVAEGQRWLVVGARRYGVGERVGGLRIECIHERGVIASDEFGARRHLPLYGGLTVRPAGSPVNEPVPAPACTPAPVNAAAKPAKGSAR